MNKIMLGVLLLLLLASPLAAKRNTDYSALNEGGNVEPGVGKYALPLTLLVQYTDGGAETITVAKSGDVTITDGLVEDYDIGIKTTQEIYDAVTADPEGSKDMVDDTDDFVVETASMKGRIITKFVERQVKVRFRREGGSGIVGGIKGGVGSFISRITKII